MVYSIIKKADHQFVVRSEEQDVLKCSSRRQAARTIADANDLIRLQVSEDASDQGGQSNGEPPNAAGLRKAATI